MGPLSLPQSTASVNPRSDNLFEEQTSGNDREILAALAATRWRSSTGGSSLFVDLVFYWKKVVDWGSGKCCNDDGNVSWRRMVGRNRSPFPQMGG